MIGSLGLPEILFILVLALLIFGPKRLPEIGRTVGKGLAEFRKASNDLKRTLNTELALDEEPAPSRPTREAIVRVEPAPPDAEARLRDDHEADEALPALGEPRLAPQRLAPQETVARLAGAEPAPAALAPAPAAAEPQPVPAQPLEPS